VKLGIKSEPALQTPQWPELAPRSIHSTQENRAVEAPGVLTTRGRQPRAFMGFHAAFHAALRSAPCSASSFVASCQLHSWAGAQLLLLQPSIPAAAAAQHPSCSAAQLGWQPRE
jgi:hypothetical protein